ncbi:ATP-binding protein [Vibrio crassostreae]|nr:ATP-binding protein [Vibrio crassostreae]
MHNLYSFNNIFEHSNARYLSSDQLAHEFVWTPIFESLVTNKNHVILGSRGSGKTALVKMLSHECLSQLDHPKARDIIDSKSFIATYLPLKVEWVSSISDIDDENSLFVWSLNISSCARFIDTVNSCLNSYIDQPVERVIVENKIAMKISQIWLGKEVSSLSKITNELEQIEFRKNVIFNKIKLGISLTDDEKIVGINFSSDLFKPIAMGAKVLQKELNFPEGSTFCLCIDEAEFLNKEHHKIINTHMRSFGDIVFKMTTMPYRHYTLQTLTGAPLNIGHDFEYINIDKQGPYTSQGATKQFFEDFAERLFRKRLEASEIEERNITLKSLLGESLLIDNPNEAFDESRFIEALHEHCEEKTINRAMYLLDSSQSKFSDEIERKLKGTLILKESYKNFKGNASPQIYSGYSLVVRCSDGNPRRLLRLFNHLFSRHLGMTGHVLEPLSEKEQGKRIREFSYSELENLNIEVKGKEAFELFSTIGRFLKDKLHDDKISTDVFNSFHYDIDDDAIWKHIETAVDLGLIYPDFRGSDQENKMPNRKGRFSLAFCLTPHFYLMPRKGSAVSLKQIIRYKRYLTYKRDNTRNNTQIRLDFGDDVE